MGEYEIRREFILRKAEEFFKERNYDYAGKKVMELGCRDGSLTAGLIDRGASVTFVDARPEVFNTALNQYFVQMDLNEKFPEGKWDIIFNCGLLYHLHNLDCLIKSIKRCDYLIFESEFYLSDLLVHFGIIYGDAVGGDHSVDGYGIRLTPLFTQKLLERYGVKWLVYDMPVDQREFYYPFKKMLYIIYK